MIKLDQSDWFRRVKQLLSSYFSNRKLVVLTLVLLGLIIYFWPQKLGLGSGAVVSEAAYFCLQDQLRQWTRQMAAFDTAVLHSPTQKDWEHPFVPFVGNGHLGLGLGPGEDSLRIRDGRSLALDVQLQPFVRLSLKGHKSSDAFITEYRTGTVVQMQCFSIDSQCIVISSNIFAHRKYPKVLIQDVTIRNPTEKSLELAMDREEAAGWEQKQPQKVGSESAELLSRTMDLSGGKRPKVLVVALRSTLPPSPTFVKAAGSERFRFLTVADYSEPTQGDIFANQMKLLEDSVRQTMEDVAPLDAGILASQHRAIWEKLWSVGFGVSLSRAPGVLNGDAINATRYAVLSNAAAPLHETGTPDVLRQELAVALRRNNLCFNSHNTLLYPSKLWSDLRSSAAVADVAFRWRLTLEKRGCDILVGVGADGIAQALVLSFGGFKFTNDHLEFHTHPNELHRDYLFSGIAFDNVTRVNVWVEVGSDNKASLFASVNHSFGGKRRFFACDAGCLDPPVELTAERRQFPVKLTDPLTPILFVTPDREHMEELKHTIHVKEVMEAPAHEHHVMALHKHGHRLGGLPTLFWLSLAFLILTFHLFLCKLIYNEYCRDEKTQFPRGRYSV